MNNLGEVFKRVRKSRNLTQESVARGVISKSTLSGFENNKHDITLSNFYKIVRNTNISFQEFEYMVNDYELEGFKRTWIKAVDLYNNNEVSALKSLLKRERANQEDRSTNIYDELNYLRLKNLVSVVDEDFVLSQNERKRILSYLMSIKDWGNYELVLYGNAVRVFDTTTIKTLSTEVVTRSSFYRSISDNKRLVAKILINTINKLLECNELESAIRFQKHAQDLLDEADVFEKTIFLFISGAIDFCGGNKTTGKEKMIDAIAVFEKIGSHRLADSYQADYDKIVGSSEK